MSTTPQRVFIIGALNRRGIKGTEARVLLHRFSQRRIARQIDYYDFEIVSASGLRLPPWAAAPWLSRRIRRDLSPPRGYRRLLPGVQETLDRL